MSDIESTPQTPAPATPAVERSSTDPVIGRGVGDPDTGRSGPADVPGTPPIGGEDDETGTNADQPFQAPADSTATGDTVTSAMEQPAAGDMAEVLATLRGERSGVPENPEDLPEGGEFAMSSGGTIVRDTERFPWPR